MGKISGATDAISDTKPKLVNALKRTPATHDVRTTAASSRTADGLGGATRDDLSDLDDLAASAATERTTDEATERTTDEATERTTDEATERTTDEATERATDEATERTTDEATERATDEASTANSPDLASTDAKPMENTAENTANGHTTGLEDEGADVWEAVLEAPAPTDLSSSHHLGGISVGGISAKTSTKSVESGAKSVGTPAPKPPPPPIPTSDQPSPANHDWLRSMIQEIGDRLAFEPESHQYTIKATTQPCVSVSTLMSTFTPVFKGKEIADKMGDRKGIPADEILEDWRIRRDYSVVRGTEFHLYVNTFLTTGRRRPLQTPIDHVVRSFHQFWDGNAHRFQRVASEFMLYDEDLALAGTIDSLFFHPKTGKYIIFDWKTNRNIRMENAYHEKLLGPFDDLDACEYSKYSIQMTLYRELIKRSLGLDVARAFIIHFEHAGTYKVIEAANLDVRVDETLNHLPKLHDELKNTALSNV